MANFWQTLKNIVGVNVHQNNNREITGHDLQVALFDMINSLGENYAFAGIATPSDSPGVPDGPVFYLASQKGVYPNFSNVVVSQPKKEIAVISWNGNSWDKNILSTVVDADEYDLAYRLIRQHLDTLQEQADSLQDSLDKITIGVVDDIEQIKSEIVNINRAVSSIGGQVNGMQDTVNDILGDIEALQKKITTLESQTEAQEHRIANIETDIDELRTVTEDTLPDHIVSTAYSTSKGRGLSNKSGRVINAENIHGGNLCVSPYLRIFPRSGDTSLAITGLDSKANPVYVAIAFYDDAYTFIKCISSDEITANYISLTPEDYVDVAYMRVAYLITKPLVISVSNNNRVIFEYTPEGFLPGDITFGESLARAQQINAFNFVPGYLTTDGSISYKTANSPKVGFISGYIPLLTAVTLPIMAVSSAAELAVVYYIEKGAPADDFIAIAFYDNSLNAIGSLTLSQGQTQALGDIPTTAVYIRYVQPFKSGYKIGTDKRMINSTPDDLFD